MYISRIAVKNYKSFFESSELVFQPGFNVIIGQNSSGKTALLEALSLNFPFVPHRSVKTIPIEGGVPDQISAIDVSVTVSSNEIMEFLFPGSGESLELNLTAVDFTSRFARERLIGDPKSLIDWFLRAPEHTFMLRLSRYANGTQGWNVESSPSYGHYEATPLGGTAVSFVRFTLARDGRIAITQTAINADKNNEIGRSIAPQFPRFVYLFRAERFNLARRPFGASDILLPDASNLPEVLNTLQGHRSRFARFIDLVKSVLPQIKDVTVRPAASAGQHVEIRVWTSDLDRVDLAKPLDACGTGIGQVLAILYVAVNSPHPGVILIDEPQSFLHPGAARKLIQILRDYPEHQYFCSTHSAAIVSSAEPETITVTRLSSEDRTEVIQVDPNERGTLETCLAEVGARLSDVFGADRILWVEGRTEETCFPIILGQLAGRRLMGTVIVGLRSTGELEGGDAERILDIYSRLSNARSLMPPTIGFVFDQDGRTAEQRKNILRRTGPNVKFLPRRMYENYLLIPDSISAVLSALDVERTDGHSREEVQAILDSETNKSENFRPLNTPSAVENWRNTINGAKVLAAIFGTLSEHRARYDKVRDGEALTKHIIVTSPEELLELSQFLAELLP
jgi:predicted ATPase